MKFKHYVLGASVIICALTFVSCNKVETKPDASNASSARQTLEEMISENGTNADEAIFKTPAVGGGHLYVETNRRSKNTILIFGQKQNGELVLSDEIASGGNGNGEDLGSQSAIVISEYYHLLFAVNAGSNSISSFRINENGSLTLLFTANSYGQKPNSVTVHNNLLYVLNNSSSDICGFSFSANGFMKKIEGSYHALSGMGVDAPQIKFHPEGGAVFVPEKVTNIINKFSLDANGAIASAIQIASKGVTPFGFDFARNNHYMIVSNAAGGATGAGSCTSYKYDAANGLMDINNAVSNFESAPCWLATTKYGAFAFVSNTGSHNLSSYYIDRSGTLTLIKSVAAENGRSPIDIVVSANNRFVYNINKDSHTLTGYQRMSGGTLKFVEKITSLPNYAVGLAAY